MRRYIALIIAVIAVGVACTTGRHSSAGFRLAADGNVDRGKHAFVQLGCNNCHEVAGSDLSKPTEILPVPVVLGGMVSREVTDGWLVASIINPSHSFGRYPKDLMMVNNQSRMPSTADQMTVRQLTDIVEFLQRHYTVRQPLDRAYY